MGIKEEAILQHFCISFFYERRENKKPHYIININNIININMVMLYCFINISKNKKIVSNLFHKNVI